MNVGDYVIYNSCNVICKVIELNKYDNTIVNILSLTEIKNNKFTYPIKRALTIIESDYEKGLRSKASTGSIFALRAVNNLLVMRSRFRLRSPMTILPTNNTTTSPPDMINTFFFICQVILRFVLLARVLLGL